MGFKVFVINPGSTSTKIALFDSGECIFEKTARHETNILRAFPTVFSQLDYRISVISTTLNEGKIDLSDVDVFVGRGGLLKPLVGGTYRVTHDMLQDLRIARFGEHASNLGAVIASTFASRYGKEAFVANPVVVDELMDIARITGLPGIHRTSVFHALNQKAVAHRAAADLGIPYSKARFIVAHLGGGVTVGAHDCGRVIDVNNGLEEGPFSPERSGSLPILQLVNLCFSGQYSKDEIMKMLVGNGGFTAHTGNSNGKELVMMAESDKQVQLLLDAFIYRVSSEICAKAAALYGHVDRILITGGLAYSQQIVEKIKKRVSFLAPVLVYPGENEMSALHEGVLDVLEGRETALVY